MMASTTAFLAPDHCGNSPKQQFLLEVNRAFAFGEINFLTASLSEDLDWEIVGNQAGDTRSSFLDMVREMSGGETIQWIIQTVITHGKDGAVQGEIHLANGKVYAFCDVYQFTSAAGKKIGKIRSFVIG